MNVMFEDLQLQKHGKVKMTRNIIYICGVICDRYDKIDESEYKKTSEGKWSGIT